jgi:hypothetical protein
MASVEEVLDRIIRAHPLWTEHEALRSFIEPTNDSTRISFIAAFSREEEDPSGTLLMTRFGQDIVDSIRKQRDAVHSPKRYMARPLDYLGPNEAQVLLEVREARKRAGMLLPVSSEEDERYGRYAPWRGPGESFGA